MSQQLFAFILALLVIYLVLATQFESFIDPLIILLAVPMSLIGAVLALKLTSSSLNIVSQIGIIMLIGLVTNNGILIVEFANQRHEQVLTKRAAVLEAARTHFRPILGVLPIALSLGAAAGSRQSLGIAVVGGLLGATFLSLYLVPALYTFISRETKHAAAGPPGVSPETSGGLHLDPNAERHGSYTFGAVPLLLSVADRGLSLCRGTLRSLCHPEHHRR